MGLHTSIAFANNHLKSCCVRNNEDIVLFGGFAGACDSTADLLESELIYSEFQLHGKLLDDGKKCVDQHFVEVDFKQEVARKAERGFALGENY